MEYTVLWVDDDRSIVDAYQTLAEYKDIDLVHKDNWEDGKAYLKDNFDEVTAIILDANCKLSHHGVIQGDRFLGTVTAELQQLFAERQNAIPWYILSAGTMSDFGAITKCVTASRESYNDIWGKAIFLKDDIENDEENPLFEQICKVGSNKEENIVLFRHQDTFKYLGKKDYINQEARTLMLDVLSKLYHLSTTLDIKLCANEIRQTLEHIFRHANAIGILPDEFFERKNVPNLTESMCFLCGRPANSLKLKLWDATNNRSYSLFNESEYFQFNTVLSFAQKYSHTTEDILSKELCFGIALILCHIITAYGRFIDTHKDIKSIQQMWTKVEDDKSTVKSQINPKSYQLINHIVEGCIQYSNGVYHIEDVKVPLKFKDYYGSSRLFRIEKVMMNENKTKDRFPYYTVERYIIEIK